MRIATSHLKGSRREQPDSGVFEVANVIHQPDTQRRRRMNPLDCEYDGGDDVLMINRPNSAGLSTRNRHIPEDDTGDFLAINRNRNMGSEPAIAPQTDSFTDDIQLRRSKYEEDGVGLSISTQNVSPRSRLSQLSTPLRRSLRSRPAHRIQTHFEKRHNKMYIELPTLSQEEKLKYTAWLPTHKKSNSVIVSSQSHSGPSGGGIIDLTLIESESSRPTASNEPEPSLVESNDAYLGGNKSISQSRGKFNDEMQENFKVSGKLEEEKRSFKRNAKGKRVINSRVLAHPEAESQKISNGEDDILAELAMDEPERFKSASRLRSRKVTAYQRKLRKAYRRRIIDGQLQTVHSTKDDSEVSSERDSSSTSDSHSGLDDFITDSGDELEEGMMPVEFSLCSVQTPAFKFKVVFQYYVMLVMKGPKVLLLRGENASYLLPPLNDLRSYTLGIKNMRVRSQIWRPQFVKALETFPIMTVVRRDVPESYCFACNRHKQLCYNHVVLSGNPYDKETHEIEDSDSSNSDSSLESSSSKLLKQFDLGNHCTDRSQMYHALCHWEDELYCRIRGYYRDLLRAKFKPVPDDSEASTSESDSESDYQIVARRRADRERRRVRTHVRIKQLRQKGPLPDEYKNVDRVTEWMDAVGHQNKNFKWFQSLAERSGKLEADARD